jgi:hypothetical protein
MSAEPRSIAERLGALAGLAAIGLVGVLWGGLLLGLAIRIVRWTNGW